MTIAASEMNALKLSSVLQERIAIPLYSFSFPKKCGSSRILGWRRCRHSYRAARTRLRRLSVAIKDFFICVTEPVLEEARQLCRSGPHIVFLNKRLGQFRHRNVWPAIHCCLEKPRKHFQSAAAFWSAPLGWCDGTRLSAALPNPHGTRR